MKEQGPGRRVRIYIGENDQWHGRPLYAAIVQEARKRGLAGATVARGIMGYGAHSAIHEPHLFALAHDLPVVIEIVDTEEKVRQFLPCLDEMVREGMITTSEVEIIAYRAEP
jgi:PII-like signaling protein